MAYIKSEKSGESVSGAASLTVDKKSHQLTVAVELTGLTPKHKYTLRIADGTVVKVYDLNSIEADTKGSGTSMTQVGKVDNILSTWTVQVVNTDSKTAIASGKVQPQNRDV